MLRSGQQSLGQKFALSILFLLPIVDFSFLGGGSDVISIMDGWILVGFTLNLNVGGHIMWGPHKSSSLLKVTIGHPQFVTLVFLGLGVAMGLVTSSQPKRKSAFKLIYRFGTPCSNFLTIKYSLKRKAEMVLKNQIETGELLLVSKAGLSSCVCAGPLVLPPPFILKYS